jgi:uncharacterized membrane protein
MFHLYFYPIADSYLLVFAAAIVLLAALALLRGGSRLGRRQRMALLALRTVAIAMVLLAMLRPTIVYTETKKQPATLAVLVDETRSMSVRDAFDGQTRWEALSRAVADTRPALGKLAKEFEIEAYAFDDKIHPLKIDGGKISLAETPEGQQTAIGAALEEVARRNAGKRLLGMILLSDGKETALSNLPPQTAAARLKQLGCRLFAFVFGQSRGLGQTQDVSVKDLVVNHSIFIKNQLTASGQIRVDGYVNRAIPVRLLFETSPGKMEVVAEQTVRAAGDGQLLPVKFNYVPPMSGQWKVAIEAVPQPGELVTTNNQLADFVTVRDGGLNVLYLEGGVRVEQRFLRRELDSSPDIKVDYVRLDPRHPDVRPKDIDLAKCFQPGKYDAYIIGDLDSAAFRDNELKDLAGAVSKGAGLIMLGGAYSFGPGGYADTPLAGVLPVAIDRLERQNLDDPIRSDLHLGEAVQMRPTEIGLLHFALMLAGTRAENEALWKQLPPLDGANRFKGVKPGALVLADDGRGHPLLVAQQYGGRVLAFAGDSTWRWQMHGFTAAYKRFWRQVVLWLARRDESAKSNVWIKLDRRRFDPAERVEFTAGANAEGLEPIKDADYGVELTLPDGSRKPLQPTRKDDQIQGAFTLAQASGDYAIEVRASAKGQPIGTAKARFLVSQRDLELDDASADADLMQDLAARTGGELLPSEQLPDLIGRLLAQSKSLDVLQETKQRLWDTWPFFLIVVAALSLEWYLRKRWGLV